MIFKDIKEIKKDIYSRIFEHIQINVDIDIPHIVSLLKPYLFELQIKKEIDGYQTNIVKTQKNTLFVEITKNNIINSFIINVDIELRKLKINKINNNNSSYILYN